MVLQFFFFSFFLPPFSPRTKRGGFFPLLSISPPHRAALKLLHLRTSFFLCFSLQFRYSLAIFAESPHFKVGGFILLSSAGRKKTPRMGTSISTARRVLRSLLLGPALLLPPCPEHFTLFSNCHKNPVPSHQSSVEEG